VKLVSVKPEEEGVIVVSILTISQTTRLETLRGTDVGILVLGGLTARSALDTGVMPEDRARRPFPDREDLPDIERAEEEEEDPLLYQ
jgi:hypothetical protein